MKQELSRGVTIKNLTKEFQEHQKKVRVVDNISVDIHPGELVTLLGPSGCGKTTTLRMIAGFETITSGDIYLGDKLINNLTPDKRDTAMVFQSYALFPNYNVFDNIAYGLKLKKLQSSEIKTRVNNIIKLVGLEGMEKRQINQLSGGQQQRVALARSLVVEPGVLLFDEPLSNLDAQLRVYMRTEIRKIQKKLGITALYVTHDQSEAMSLSDRIIILNKGEIMQVGTPKEVYYHPANKFVASFIGTVNFIKGTILKIEDDRADVKIMDRVYKGIEFSGDQKVGAECDVVVRPEAIELDKENGLPCKVTLSTFMGSYQYYEVKFVDSLIQVHQYNPKMKETHEEGSEIFIDLNEKDLFIV